MGRPGIGYDDVATAAESIAASEGAGAVTLRRVRRELGSGSLQTIHRHLESWKTAPKERTDEEVYDSLLDKEPVQKEVAIKFIPPVDEFGKASLIGSIKDRNGNVNCRGGQPPEGVLIIDPPNGEIIARKLGLPFAKAVRYECHEWRDSYKQDRKEFEAIKLGLAFEASHAEIVTRISDEVFGCNNSWELESLISRVYERIKREQIEFRVVLPRELAERLHSLSSGSVPAIKLAELIEKALQPRDTYRRTSVL